MRSQIGRAIDGILVLCALATTFTVISRSAFPVKSEGDSGMRRFNGWQKDLAFNRRIGKTDAPYRLVVWTDYQCPACKRFENEIEHLRAQLGDSIAIIYRHYPLTSHPLAFQAAVAAECARDVGEFEAMHKALFSTTLTGDSLPIASLAAKAAIKDVEALRRCLMDLEKSEAVRTDMARGDTLGIRGTPTLHIGDRIRTGGILAQELIPLLKSSRR